MEGGRGRGRGGGGFDKRAGSGRGGRGGAASRGSGRPLGAKAVQRHRDEKRHHLDVERAQERFEWDHEDREEVMDEMVENNFSFGKKKSSGGPLPASMAAIAERAHGDPLEAEFLNLSKMNLSELPDLSSCERLKRLDLSCNSLSSAEGISGCRGITWLSLKDNQVSDLAPLRRMGTLNVLVLSSNQVERLSQLERVSKLNSLIANNNLISSFEGITGLGALNNLVLSHNKITEIPNLAALRNLKKLSLAHNQIRVLPDLCSHPLLEELRLNDNRIMKVPTSIDRSPALKLLDLGRNRLFDISDVQNISNCRKIKNLNLQGNQRLCALEGYRDKVVTLCIGLEIFDGKRVAEKPAKKKVTGSRDWNLEPGSKWKPGKFEPIDKVELPLEARKKQPVISGKSISENTDPERKLSSNDETNANYLQEGKDQKRQASHTQKKESGDGIKKPERREKCTDPVPESDREEERTTGKHSGVKRNRDDHMDREGKSGKKEGSKRGTERQEENGGGVKKKIAKVSDSSDKGSQRTGRVASGNPFDTFVQKSKKSGASKTGANEGVKEKDGGSDEKIVVLDDGWGGSKNRAVLGGGNNSDGWEEDETVDWESFRKQQKRKGDKQKNGPKASSGIVAVRDQDGGKVKTSKDKTGETSSSVTDLLQFAEVGTGGRSVWD